MVVIQRWEILLGVEGVWEGFLEEVGIDVGLER